jgi:hypothetical protein
MPLQLTVAFFRAKKSSAVFADMYNAFQHLMQFIPKCQSSSKYNSNLFFSSKAHLYL